MKRPAKLTTKKATLRGRGDLSKTKTKATAHRGTNTQTTKQTSIQTDKKQSKHANKEIGDNVSATNNKQKPMTNKRGN